MKAYLVAVQHYYVGDRGLLLLLFFAFLTILKSAYYSSLECKGVTFILKRHLVVFVALHAESELVLSFAFEKRVFEKRKYSFSS